MDFVTSDLHFNHHNICGPDGFCETRTHFETTEDMNATIIRNWNARVTNADTVYHLGDMGMNVKPAALFELMNQLNGTIYLAKGNHDSSKLLNYLTHEHRNPIMPATGERKFIAMPMGTIVKRDGVQYYLTHYPQGLGEQRKKIRNLCGHIHDQIARDANVLNVGIDSLEIGERPFAEPIPLDEAMDMVTAKWTTWHERFMRG